MTSVISGSAGTRWAAGDFCLFGLTLFRFILNIVLIVKAGGNPPEVI